MKVSVLPVLFAAFFVSSCASMRPGSGFSSGEEKNSLPFASLAIVEEVNSIAVPPFYGDDQGWKDTAYGVLAASDRAAIVSVGESYSVTRAGRKDLASLPPENRIDFLASLGKSVQTDAVLNGVIMRKGDKSEIILQLVSSRDARVLWWQSVDFRPSQSAPSHAEQEDLVVKMMDPLLRHIGLRKPLSKASQLPETPPQPAKVELPRNDIKPGKETPSQTAPGQRMEQPAGEEKPAADFSPM